MLKICECSFLTLTSGICQNVTDRDCNPTILGSRPFFNPKIPLGSYTSPRPPSWSKGVRPLEKAWGERRTRVAGQG